MESPPVKHVHKTIIAQLPPSQLVQQVCTLSKVKDFVGICQQEKPWQM